MCGIAGIINYNGFPYSEIIKMTNIIRHRGPDDEGFVIQNKNYEKILVYGGSDTPTGVCNSSFTFAPKNKITDNKTEKAVLAFGHRRLSILDQSPAGHQPMSYANNRYWIVFNGEIYNYLEIKEELIKRGYHFCSNSDTEVVLASYAEWQDECQHKFNGMWAFVIYDSEKKEIFMSRDRYGIKPLYYWFSPDGSFCFGSEIKQFTVLSGWNANLNHQRAYDYLFYALTDHTDETMFRGVFHIPAGCCFKSEITKIKVEKQNKIDYTRWFIPEYIGYNDSFEKAKEEFKELFKAAVDLHLRSDVPVGSALSGGLDSSAIVSYVNILLRQKGKTELQKTFSSCSIDKRYDEKIWIDEVVKHTAVDAHFVFPEGQNIFNLTEKIIWHQDEPYQSQSAYLSYHVFEKAKKENVIVLLNGQGADEYLSGYGAFKIFRHRQYLKKFKIDKIFKEMREKGLFQKWLYILKLLYAEMPLIISEKISCHSKHYREYQKLFLRSKLNYKKIHPYRLIPYKQRTIFEIAHHQLLFAPLQKYLRWEDRNSMAHSVEARVPFLDYRLVEFTTQLPIDYLDDENATKKILIQALKGILPEVIRNRKDKKGFITPEQRWFTEDFYNEFIAYFKNNVQYAQGIINEKYAIEYMEKVKKGDIEFDYTYWRIISFCIWMKVFNVTL
jgi:asparagine synthase (glutamine-hydrolysing)